MKKIASIDVFDTLIFRRTGTPFATHYFLGRRFAEEGSIQVDAMAFAYLRRSAEARAFANAKGLDSNTNLYDIYKELQFTLELKKGDIDKLVQQEIEFELSIFCTFQSSINLLDDYRSKGYQIAFLSDMYLSSTVIRQALQNCGLYQEGDLIYVSNEHELSKSTGQLYYKFLNDQGLSSSDYIHVGDNARSDVKIPKALGLETSHFRSGDYNRFEKILESCMASTGATSSIYAATSRRCRNLYHSTDKDTATLTNISASFVAPVLVTLVTWVLRRAVTLGLNRLYFVARDGQILHQIAQRLCVGWQLDIEVRYLYGSRQAWMLPSLLSAEDDFLSGIFQMNRDVDHQTVRLLLNRMDMTPEMISESLEENGFDFSEWDSALSSERSLDLYNLMNTDVGIQACILERAAAARETALQYFEQEGLLRDDDYAFVDLGRNATLHNSLAAILNHAGKPSPASFYIGSGDSHPQYGRPEPFLMNTSNLYGFFDLPQLITSLEMFCSADHGTVTGYQHNGETGKIAPILKSSDNPIIMEWGFGTIRNTVLNYVELLPYDLLDMKYDCRICFPDLFEQLFVSPHREEAKALGAFPMEDGWGDYSFHRPIAPGFKVSDFLGPRKRHTWNFGNIALLPNSLGSAARKLILSFRALRKKIPFYASLIKMRYKIKSRAGSGKDSL